MAAGLIARSLALAVLCLLALSAAAQDPARTVAWGFERDVNRYAWHAEALLPQLTLGAWRLDLANRFSADAFLLSGDAVNVRDENLLAIAAARPLGGTDRRYGLLVDARTLYVGQAEVTTGEALAGLRVGWPALQAFVEPMAGVAFDQRPGAMPEVDEVEAPLRTDAGPALGVRFAASPPNQPYRVQAQGEALVARMDPRASRTFRVTARAEQTFETVEMALAVRGTRLRRDVYQAASFLNRRPTTTRLPETVEATTTDTLATTLSVALPLTGRLRLSGEAGLDLRRRATETLRTPEDAIFFDTDLNRQATRFAAAVLYEAPRLDGRLAIERRSAVEDRQLLNRDALPPAEAAGTLNQLRQADFDEGALGLSGFLRATPLRRLQVRLDGAASILRHDTPTANPDDRDEAVQEGRLALRYRLRDAGPRTLDVELNTYASRVHTVYLQAARSAQNNRRTALRMRPALVWRPGARTRFEAGAEARATYTRFDFVLPGRSAQDQSARELRYDVSAEHEPDGGPMLRLDAAYSDLRLGRLVRDRFAEIPFDTLRTWSTRLTVGTRPLASGLRAEVGLRLFRRSDYDRAAAVRYTREDGSPAVFTGAGRSVLLQIGPVCQLVWPTRLGATLRLEGWANAQRQRVRLYGPLPDGEADRIRRAADRGRRQFIPNLSLAVTWPL